MNLAGGLAIGETMKGKLSQADFRPSDLIPGDYYQRNNGNDKHIESGEYVVITNVDEKHVHFNRGDSEYYDEINSFYQDYIYVPNGAEIRSKQLMDLMLEARDMQRQEREMAVQLGNLDRPLISAGAEELDEALDKVGDGVMEATVENQALLVQAPDIVRARDIKKGVALARNEALKFQKKMKVMKDKILSLQSEQRAFLNAASNLTTMVKVAEEVIWTVNIYLGRGEEIVQLKEGLPADAEERISVRQLVLYADEEMAIKPLEGGIDCNDLDQLDDWLLQKDNLNQVLPESRGIIAFKIRRSKKRYFENELDSAATAIASAQYNIKNKQTYFLLRNGDNLYRVTTDLSVDEVLVPTSTEFDSLFEKSEYNRETEEHEIRKIKPGTPEFSKAMDDADATQRHYGRVLLFMQGIIDRTKIFAPLMSESSRVNLLDRKNHESYIRYIYDAQNLLPTGKLPFWKWVQAVNKDIAIGHRVIGIFTGYGGLQKGTSGSDYGKCDRINPPRAKFPDNLKIYTIDGKRHDTFFFHYDREEKILVRQKTRYGRSTVEERDAKTRASCTIYATDKFYLDFDNVEIEDMKFYLTSRVDRHEYITMFPLVETLLLLKEKEAKEEAPFKKLLIGQIMKAYGADREDVEARLPALVKWWKFKNREHRSLTKDDALALRVIIQEYGLSTSRSEHLTSNKERIEQATELLKDHYSKSLQHLLYIGHRDGNHLVVLIAENENNVFVNEQIWLVNMYAKEPTVIESRPWRTVDKRRLRWRELYASSRWPQWRKELKSDEHLTDPEIRILQNLIWSMVKNRQENRHNHKKNSLFWPLALTLQYDQDVKAYYYDEKFEVDPVDIFMNNRGYIQEPTISYNDLGWSRKHGEMIPNKYLSYGGHHSSDRDHQDDVGASKPWNRVLKFERELKTNQTKPILLETYPENIIKYEQEFAIYERVKTQIAKWTSMVQHASWLAKTRMKERWLAIEYQQYLNEHGDPELWDDELKQRERKAPHFAADGFYQACKEVVVKNIPIIGKTVEMILENRMNLLTEVEQKYLPMDYIIPNPKSEDDDESEESEDGEE